MASYPEYSAYLKSLMIDAARGELSMVGSDEEDACARWIAYGTINFLARRVDVGVAAATDVTTWKRMSDSYGAFDVQAGYVASKRPGQNTRGRANAGMTRAGGNRYTFSVRDWGSDYSTSYSLQLLRTEGGYRLDDCVKPAAPYPSYWEVEA